jgi:hypothetical protein
MHKTLNLNKFRKSYEVFEKHSRLCLMRKKSSKTHKECLNNFFGPRFLSQTPYVLMCMKCMNLTRTQCPIVI